MPHKSEINDFRIVESLVASKLDMIVVCVVSPKVVSMRRRFSPSIVERSFCHNALQRCSLSQLASLTDIAMRDRLAELDAARGCNWSPSTLR